MCATLLPIIPKIYIKYLRFFLFVLLTPKCIHYYFLLKNIFGRISDKCLAIFVDNFGERKGVFHTKQNLKVFLCWVLCLVCWRNEKMDDDCILICSTRWSWWQSKKHRRQRRIYFSCCSSKMNFTTNMAAFQCVAFSSHFGNFVIRDARVFATGCTKKQKWPCKIVFGPVKLCIKKGRNNC